MCHIEKKPQSPSKLNSVNLIKLTARIPVDYYLVSSEQLLILKNGSKKSSAIEYSIFFFSIFCSLLLTYLFNEIESEFLTKILIVAITFSLCFGIYYFKQHSSSKKSIDDLLEKINQNKCNLED
jgi:hypothetical protein